MKARCPVLRLPASVGLLTFGLALCFAYLAPANKLSSASAQVTSPHGSYGILVNQWKDASSNNASALVGVLNFDGAGNITGSYTLVSKNSPTTGMLTGTYSGNSDGSNTVNLTFDVGATATLSLAVTDAGTGLQFMVSGGSLIKPGQVVTGTGRIQSALGTTPAGSYGFLLNVWPDANNQPLGVFGVVNLDGAKNVTGSYTLVGAAVGPAPVSGSFTGTYSINPDSTGTLTANLDIGIGSTIAIVVTDGGTGLLMLQTGESDGLSHVESGTARMQ